MDFDYISQRLVDIEAEAAATIKACHKAKEVALENFSDETPTPSVVPDWDGGVQFVWHKDGADIEMTVSADKVEAWGQVRETGVWWSCYWP